MTMPSSQRNNLFSLFFLFSNLWLVALSVEVSKQKSNPSADLTAAASIAIKNYKDQSLSPRSSVTTPNQRYGYPYAIAPTLTPIINARSDEYENDAEFSKPKPYGSKLSTSEDPLKKSSLKKYKAPFSYGAARRQGFEEASPLEKRFRAYKEPKYRNFDELESRFRPRRIDINDPYYSGYEYVPKSSRRPSLSPRDPYLSPSNEPSDGFYPVTKVKSYATPYIQSGPNPPSYGAGMYEEAGPYHDDLPYDDYEKDSYQGPSPHYPPSSGHYEYQEDYEIESNKPITGDIRKRLLDYAGASDMYEGEPDYLQRVARNKNKYGHVANDYYAYGGPGYRSSYKDYPYVESKVMLVKKSRL